MSIRRDIQATISRIVLAMVFVCASNAYTMSPLDQKIINVAQTNFVNEFNAPRSVDSNPAVVAVAAALGVDLADDRLIQAVPGQTIAYPHVLTNTGNVTDSYALSVAQLASDSGDFVNTRVALDTNQNGLFDGTDTEITVSPDVLPGETVSLLVLAEVAVTAIAGENFLLSLTATSQTDAIFADTNTDTAVISGDGILLLNKTSSKICASDLAIGEIFTYTVSYSVLGAAIPLSTTINLNGAAKTGLLIEDVLAIELSLSQTEPSVTGNGDVLVQTADDAAADVWQKFTDWNGVDRVSAVGLFIETAEIAVVADAGFEFSVTLNSGVTAGLIQNIAIADVDNDAVSDAQSNTVCNTIPEIIAFDLDPDRSLVFELKNDDRTVVYEHQLFNQGTVDDRYTLELTPQTESTVELETVQIFIDDGDGVFNISLDTLYTGGSIAIAIGASARLFVQGSVPITATEIDLSSQLLLATSVRDPSVIDSHTEVTEFVAEGPAFLLTKASSKACILAGPELAEQDGAERLAPGQQYTYSINFRNNGDTAPLAQSFEIDNRIQTGVMLFDEIPYGLSLAAGQSFAVIPTAAQVVVKRFEDLAADKWLSYGGWNGSDALAVIGVLYDAAVVGKRAEGSFEFDVIVNDTVTAGAAFFNTAFFDYDNNGNADAISNQVCNLVELVDENDPNPTVPTAEIRFLAPTLDLILGRIPPQHASDEQFVDATLYRLESDVIAYNPSTDGVFIEVSSSTLREGDDFIVLVDGRRQVVVDVESEGTGDKAKVVLRETVPGSGVYRSIRALVLSDVTGNGGGICPENTSSEIDFSVETDAACRLLSQQDDDLIVSITDTGINKKLEDDAIVDPLGIVFDSTTLQPVAGATVVVCTHLPAGENSDSKFDDGVVNDQCGAFGELAIDPFSPTREPLPIQTTGADGFYQYAFLFAGDYFIDINPPEGYAWPSDAPIARFTGQAAVGRDRTLEVLDPSYGIDGFAGNVADSGVFNLSVIRPILVVDLPVDPVIIDLSVNSNCDANGRVDGDAGPLTYSVSFLNSGNLTPPERSIQVDGLNTSGVLFESRLPFETTPIAGTSPVLTPGGAALLQTYSDLGSNNWIAFASWDGITSIAQVGALFSASDVDPGESGTITIEVEVTGNLTDGTVLQNTISVDVDGDGSPESQTQAACNVSGPEAEINFLAPSAALRAANQAPDFNNDADFIDIGQYRLNSGAANYSSTSDGIYIQLRSTAIPDTDFVVLNDGRRQVVVVVTSSLGNATRSVTLQEVVEGGGVYRAVRPLVLSETDTGSNNVCPNEPSPSVDYVNDPGADCILLAAANDTLTVSFIDALGPHTDEAIVDPLGVVFDSQTLLPVAGATVSIRNLDGSLPNDPFTGLPLQPQLTGSDGRYQYPFMFPGTYFLTVEPPTGYAFPSTFSPATFAGTVFTVSDASYGRDGFNAVAGSGEFTLDANNNLLVVDFPIDFFGDALLTIDKSASLKEVELGGLVEYTVNVRNVADAPIANLILEDKLPYGFKYVARTLRKANILIAEPAGAPGPVLRIPVGILLKDEQVSIQYYLQATAGAVDSDGINTAIARGDFSGAPIESNVARAKVELIRRGVLSDKAYIFGKVYMDSDCNNIQSDGEWPIGAVKIYMEDGTYAITDENGQYSLYGLEPGLHVLKVDPLTMPIGLTLKPIDNRHAAAGDSRFADLVSGEYHRADFAAACPPAEMIEDIQTQVMQRNQAINANWMLDEAERFDPTERSTVRSDALRANNNGDLSQGIIGSAQTNNGINGQVGLGVQNQSPVVPTIYNAADNLIVVETEPDNKMPLTADVVQTVTAAQAKTGEWLWPLDDISLYGRFMVVIRSGIKPTLYLNGEAVSNNQLGEQFLNKRERAQVLAWYGLQLKPGPNLLEVKGKDPFGNMRTLASKTFHSLGDAEKLVLETQATLPADGGRSAAEVTLSLLDAFGQPARGVHFVTLEIGDGLWVEEDIQDLNPGFQVRVRNGQRTLHLRSSEYTGEVKIKATVDKFEAETNITFVASNRSLVVAGVAEVGYSQSLASGDATGPTDQDEGLDKSAVDTRAALFLKGRVKGDMHLTLSYDTDKNSDEELLRDINPNEYYPIPGDNSVRGFEAQSRSKLYAKLEKDRHSLLWGDYVTDLNSSYRDLGRVQRTLTGIRGIYDDGRLRALAFGAEEDDDFQQVELAANGTALLYTIPGAPLVRNSEILEIVTRDRDSRALIVSSETLQRFVDYTVDYLSGNIRFVRAIPTLDAELNPNFIRVSFSVEGDGSEHAVVGARVEYDVNTKVTVGANYTADANPRSGNTVSGVFANFKPTEKTNVMVSTATMSHEDATKEDGNAVMLEVKHQWQHGGNTTATYGKSEAGFTNAGAGIRADNQEVRINHNQPITSKLSLTADYLDSETLSNGKQRQSVELRGDYKLQEWTLRAGTRAITNSGAGTDDKANTLIVGAGRTFTLLGRGGNINTEYEVETGDQNRQRWAADATWQAFEKAKVYGRYEQLNSLTGGSGLSSNEKQTSASFGVESDWLPSTTVYNEYRMRGVTDSRNLEAATGVRGDYEIIPGLRVSPTLELINTMDGATDNSSTALSFGLSDSRDKNARKLMRVETRFDDSRKYYGFDGTYVARVNLEWSSFFREDLRITENKSSENTLNQVFTVGFARRPRLENRYHGLWLYQWKVDKGSIDREVHLFSTHQNLQLSDNWVVSGRLGFKVEEFDLLGTNVGTNAGLVDGRAIWDITRRIDVDVHGGLLATNGGDELRYAFGIGANLLLNRNLRLNVGYNIAGFEEKDLDNEGYNASGAYIGLQFKFDEKAFDWLAYDPTQMLETDNVAESGNE